MINQLLMMYLFIEESNAHHLNSRHQAPERLCSGHATPFKPFVSGASLNSAHCYRNQAQKRLYQPHNNNRAPNKGRTCINPARMYRNQASKHLYQPCITSQAISIGSHIVSQLTFPVKRRLTPVTDNRHALLQWASDRRRVMLRLYNGTARSVPRYV